MKLHQTYSPETVGELRKLIESLPDGMELRYMERGALYVPEMSLALRGKGDKRRTVSRGGVPFLALHDF
ncbi:hypothetical protein [Caballeronia sp. LZ034LL]|uniref:hypothetical protein n=1 Tax=Caballeronia sp. LZ034LL TaxID=3038567 RepID=UPI002862309F|nr:hypothetical protein [Caballeronia sp. LZ034LL]MDR5839381.1 hypothetical protein [Caballeronia sp. LZ034LL]